MVALPVDNDNIDSAPVADTGTGVSIDSVVSKLKDNYKKTIVVVLLLVTLFWTNTIGYLKIALQPLDDTTICPIYETIAPNSFHLDNSTVLDILYDEKFRLNSISKLAGSVQVDTTVFDNQPDVPDAPEQWVQFKDFHKYLKTTFPTVFETFQVDYVNTYGIVLYWAGSDKLLKPVMLTAHQDVVPVQQDTLNGWSYPPFSGHYDGEYIFGRGSLDCKNVLIAIMEALELLVADKDFKPVRGIVAAFGFDEEASGRRGALNIGKWLESKFGSNSIYAILDEGPGIMTDKLTGNIVAMAATGEKGYMDVKVSLTTPGGHSSVPPDHTLIGIMSELAYLIESDPYQPILSPDHPILGYLKCLAVNTGNKLPKLARKSILRAGFDKLANSKVVQFIAKDKATRYLIQTSQALDLLIGGEKANALPESVSLVINHRISIESSLLEIQNIFISRVVNIAKKHGLGVISFNGEVIIPATSKGHFEVELFSTPLKSAPTSPSDTNVWKYLAGVTRHVFEDLGIFPDNKDPVFLAPAIMPANTDTKYYWNLTKNIFRYSPFFVSDPMAENHIHSVDERIRVDGHLQLIAFFYEYIQAVNTKEANQ